MQGYKALHVATTQTSISMLYEPSLSLSLSLCIARALFSSILMSLLRCVYCSMNLCTMVSDTGGKKLGGAKNAVGMTPSQLAGRAAELRAEVGRFHET